jgi:hypothetical protein
MALLIGFTTLTWSGCGVIGSPMAPEDVGVAPIIERQKRSEAQGGQRTVQEAPAGPLSLPGLRSGEGYPVQEQEELPVPPVQSVGTRP